LASAGCLASREEWSVRHSQMSFLFREYGARPHQNGRGPGNDAPGHYGSGYFNLSQRAGSPGPLIEHVKDGKPLTALGKKLVAVAGHQPCCVGPTS
jgi:hypothetical protein